MNKNNKVNKPKPKKSATKTASPKSLDAQYFQEARSWDAAISKQLKASEKLAWTIALICILVTAALSLGISFLLPLKTVEPYVIKVDSSTGIVDVISRVDTEKTIIDESTQEVIDKYWVYKYIINRESYSWNTIKQEREIVGTLSSKEEQLAYRRENSPSLNPNAPMTLYGYNASVDVKFKSLSFLEKKGRTSTAIARIIKTTRNKNFESKKHWVVTLSYSYFNQPVEQSIRYLNPLGFQVLSYRIDAESVN